MSVERLFLWGTPGSNFSGVGDDGSGEGTKVKNDEDAMDVTEDSPADDTPAHLKIQDIPAELKERMKEGTWFIQFDEWMGMLYVATVGDGRVWVVDWGC